MTELTSKLTESKGCVSWDKHIKKNTSKFRFTGERRCTVKTIQGKWCHFPFRYRKFSKVYSSVPLTYVVSLGVQLQEDTETDGDTVKVIAGELNFYWN